MSSSKTSHHTNCAGHTHNKVGHTHAPDRFGGAFVLGITLNLGFVILEAAYGIFAGSLALIADAGHNLGDVLGLVLAWSATFLSRTAPTERHTYGLRSSSILAALFNAIFLFITVGAIAWEAIRRFGEPISVAAPIIIWVSAIGIVINGITALLFMRGRKRDINIQAAFIHMASDAGVSLGVVIAGFLIIATGWQWLDPAISLVIAGVITWGTWGLLRDSINLALHAVPRGINVSEVRQYLSALPHVKEVHDLHVWPMSTTETALTAHLVRDIDACDCALLERAAQDLNVMFEIQHATIQFETMDHRCHLAPEEKV